MADRTAGTNSAASLGDVVVTGINGNAQANTTILVNNSGRTFIVTDLFIVPTTVTTLSGAATINLGITSTAFSDIVNGVTAPSTVNTTTRATLATGANVVLNGGTLVLRVASAGTGTAYVFTAIVKGMFF